MTQLTLPNVQTHAYYAPNTRQCGHNGCTVWMADDGRPWCAVCELRRAPHLVIVDGVFVVSEGESE